MQVMAADGLIPIFLAQTLFMKTADPLHASSCSGVAFKTTGQSNTPVKLTPSNLSSSAFFFQIGLTYLKSVRADWIVPRMVANPILRETSSTVSLGRNTTSERLHVSALLRQISEQGLQPNS